MSAPTITLADLKTDHLDHLRWRYEVTYPDGATESVYVTTDESGYVLDTQTNWSIGTTGDEDLDTELSQRVCRFLTAARAIGVVNDLDARIGRRRAS